MRDYAVELPVYLELDLFNAGWNGAVNPYPGEPVHQAAMRQLRNSLVKKFSDFKANQKADDAALIKFLQINEQCSRFVRTDQQSVSEVEAIALGEAKEWVHRFCLPDGQVGDSLLSQTRVSQKFGTGNGANIGLKGTSFLQKVGTSDMSATDPSLHKLYRSMISFDPLWSDVELFRLKHRGDAIVRGSRLSFVPKTRDISRTICTEPVCNMLFQMGIGLTLADRLREVCGIDLSTQPDKNRELCRVGSLTSEFGTIDLSSASDSMSLGLVREFFPRHVTQWLELARSPVTILPDGTEVKLHMVSSMGNAYTFPLQTIFFTSLVYGAYRALNIKFERPFRHNLGSFAVFGDDIIVRSEAYSLVCRLLNICGFTVNVDKSFNETEFRESCGFDFLRGHNIRGIYIKSLNDDGDKYSAINRLNNWSARWGIPLPRLIGFLRQGLRTLYVPMDEDDIAGIKVPLLCLSHSPAIDRYGRFIYRKLSVRERSTTVSDVENRPPNLVGWINNHSAVLLAALAGTLRSGKVSIRTFRRSTRVKQTLSPRWDYVPAEYRVSGAFVDRWKLIYMTNLIC